jgi:hypothetical protein
MAADLWVSLRGERSIRPLSERPFRAVEGQHLVSTRKLVDSDEEQRVLEELIDEKKPARRDEGPKNLHYLLYTPFRYPPLRHGSRFGTRLDRGLWYGSLEHRALFAEVSYYRLLFLEGTRARLAPLELELTVFRARVKTARGVDLTRRPFAEYARELASKTSYEAAQAVGGGMRASGVEAFTFPSARDTEGGTNFGVFSPRAFAERRPSALETWFCRVETTSVEVSKKSYFERRSFRYPREQFLVRGRLPSPAL